MPAKTLLLGQIYITAFSSVSFEYNESSWVNKLGFPFFWAQLIKELLCLTSSNTTLESPNHKILLPVL